MEPIRISTPSEPVVEIMYNGFVFFGNLDYPYEQCAQNEESRKVVSETHLGAPYRPFGRSGPSVCCSIPLAIERRTRDALTQQTALPILHSIKLKFYVLSKVMHPIAVMAIGGAACMLGIGFLGALVGAIHAIALPLLLGLSILAWFLVGAGGAITGIASAYYNDFKNVAHQYTARVNYLDTRIERIKNAPQSVSITVQEIPADDRPRTAIERFLVKLFV